MTAKVLAARWHEKIRRGGKGKNGRAKIFTPFLRSKFAGPSP